MRQSLSVQSKSAETATEQRSARRVAKVAVALAVVLAAAAVVDQLGGGTLAEHATAAYSGYGQQPSTGLLYGLVYATAGVEAVLWLPVVRGARLGRRWAPALAVVAILVDAGLAATLLTVAEYGVRIFPARWGVLAALPAAVGVVVLVLLVRARRAPRT